jgi:hypothetical protein
MLLAEIMKLTGQTISATLKEGITHLHEKLLRERSTRAWDLYEKLDLGEGGYSAAPSTDSREGVRKALRKKHKR